MCDETIRDTVNLYEEHACPWASGEHTACRVRGALADLLAANRSMILFFREFSNVPLFQPPKNQRGCSDMVENAPDCLTLVPRKNCRCCNGGRCLATAYLSSTSSLPSLAAEAVAIRKRSKYPVITLINIFVQVEKETLGPVKAEGLRFLDDIGDRLTAVTGNPRQSSLKAVCSQRFIMIAFRRSFISETDNKV